MTHENYSPENILREKELKSGIVYDDPDIISTPIDQIPNKDKIDSVIQVKNETEERKEKNIESSPLEMGWKNVPVKIIPSRGKFYPDGTRIAIRPADVKEIRHFSSIDEDDDLDIEEKLTYILEKCFRMEFPEKGVVSYKDLKQEDRFFIIMTIRDLTFIKGENSILLKPYKKCEETPECPFNNGIELRTGVLSSYEIDPKIEKHYSEKTRSFIFNINKIKKSIEVFIPSIGVTQAITAFVIECAKRKIKVEETFIDIAPFIFNDWRDLNFDVIENSMLESDNWTKEEFSSYLILSEKIKIGTKLEVTQTCPICGEAEVAARISFPAGLRSLFVISDIFGELFGY
jgi:hypothetical protein